MTPKDPDRAKSVLNAAFTRYGKDLHRFLLRRIKSEQETEDLAQEVYLRLLRVENSELVRSPQDYLYGIAAHVVYQFRIRTHRDVVTYDSEALDEIAGRPQEFNTDELPEQLSLREELQNILSDLPPTHLAVYLLRKRDEFSVKEIARQLKLSVHTVKKYLTQAQIQIRVKLESKDKPS